MTEYAVACVIPGVFLLCVIAGYLRDRMED